MKNYMMDVDTTNPWYNLALKKCLEEQVRKGDLDQGEYRHCMNSMLPGSG